MAVVAPVVLALFFGSLELTAVNFARQTAGNASYEAARKMIIPGGTVDNAKAEGLRVMNLVGIGHAASVTVTDNGSTVTTRVSVPLNQVTWGLLRFTKGMTLSQSCTLSKE